MPHGPSMGATDALMSRARPATDMFMVYFRYRNSAEAKPDDESKLAPQLVVQMTGKGAHVISRANYRRSLERMNRIAWSNIPIMNYFRNRYPDHDPAEVYQRLWGETLVEPRGGSYRWNEQADRASIASRNDGWP